MPTPLTLGLPPLPPDRLYQLVSHGKINRKHNSTYQYEVCLHFVEKSARDGFHQPVSEVLSRKVNLVDSYDFVRGSLWDAAGHRVSAGLHMIDEATARTHAVFPSRYRFLFGGRQSIARPLATIISPALLPEAPLPRLFLTTAADNWVLTRQVRGITILIPCFEILRVLYYEAGPKLIEYYLRNQNLSDVCTTLAIPTTANQYTGHIRIRRRGFYKAQQCILAELCFNPHYLRSVTAAHSNLSRALLRQPEGATPQLDFLMGRPLHLEANGFHFQTGGNRYFFVCGLWALNNPFSFQQLLADLPGSKQQTINKSISNQPDKSGSNPTLFQTRQKPDTPLNSYEPASSRYQDATVRTHAKQGVTWPPVQSPAEKNVQVSDSGISRRILQTPEGLSHTPGGSDETLALVTQIDDLSREHQLTSYFQDFVDWFRQQNAYQVELLQLHNANGRFGHHISLLGKHSNEAIAIAQLQRAGHYFYFFELIAGGRAAFVHKRNSTQLTPPDFEELFSSFSQLGLNWLTYKKHLVGKEKERDAPREVETKKEFVIYPRNRHNGGVATALLCEKSIRQALFH